MFQGFTSSVNAQSSFFHLSTGAPGELQLWALLSTPEWPSRQVFGRGAATRRLPAPHTCGLPGGQCLDVISLIFNTDEAG